jgi:predicted DNA binding CopG/RHH family protein
MANREARNYEDASTLRAGKRVTPENRPQLRGHIPVRFPESLIERIKALATEDGLTVSSWIRHLVTLEIDRRSVPITVACPASLPAFNMIDQQLLASMIQTTAGASLFLSHDMQGKNDDQDKLESVG